LGGWLLWPEKHNLLQAMLAVKYADRLVRLPIRRKPARKRHTASF